MNQKWINEGGVFFPINGGLLLHDTPGQGVFRVSESSSPMDNRLGLVPVAEKFTFDYKIYPLGQEAFFDRVRSLWMCPEYIKSGKNLGIILNGLKGTGKTVAAKLLCNSLGLPVILVSDTFDGAILPFISSLEFECVIFIDEAEKTFDSDDSILLSLIDGSYNASRKLYILTTNELRLNDNLLGRPGRIRYIQEFGNLSIEAVKEYCNDNLRDESKLPDVLREVNSLDISTIDILKSIVEEFNIFGGLPESTEMNVPRAKFYYNALRVSTDGTFTAEDLPELQKLAERLNPDHLKMRDWINTCIKIPDIPEDLAKELQPQYARFRDLAVSDTTSYLKLNPGKVFEFEDDDLYISMLNMLILIHPKLQDVYRSGWDIGLRYSYIGKGMITDDGEVIENSLPGDEGFILVKDSDSGNEKLFLIQGLRSVPNLYSKIL